MEKLIKEVFLRKCMGITLFHFLEDGKFFRALDTIRENAGSPIRVAAFMYDRRYNLMELFSQFNIESGAIQSFKREEEDDEKVLYRGLVRRDDNQKEVNVYFIVSKVKQIALLVSNQSGKDWYKVLSFFNVFSPFMNRIFLRSFQILKVLRYIETENKELNLVAKSYVAKRYFGSPLTEICFEKVDYKTVFNRASDNKLWVDSIQVELQRHEAALGTVRINRRGIFSYRGMSFSEFYNRFIKKAIELYMESYLTLLENKSRSISNLEPKPIKIKLTDDVFINSLAFEKLIEKIKSKLHNWGYSIISQDGTFGHIILNDYSSGGSFDIYVSSSREIYIIPQTQVTEISFNNLLSLILDNYEGEVENV